MGEDPAHSSIAMSVIIWRPKDWMHQAMPERSISWPMSSSSGSSRASSSRLSAAYLLVPVWLPGRSVGLISHLLLS